jgi:hypothetical protein
LEEAMNQPPNNGWAPLPAPPQMPPMPYYGGQPPVAPMQSKPPGLYKALGIVQIVLGALGVCYALFTVAMLLVVKSVAATSSLYDWPMMAYSIGHCVLSVITGGMLIGGGIGVFKAKRWSRMVGIAYACISLGGTVFGTALNLLVIQPGMYARMGATAPPPGVEMISVVSALFGVLVAAILPVFTFVVLIRQDAKQQLDQ